MIIQGHQRSSISGLVRGDIIIFGFIPKSFDLFKKLKYCVMNSTSPNFDTVN